VPLITDFIPNRPLVFSGSRLNHYFETPSGPNNRLSLKFVSATPDTARFAIGNSPFQAVGLYRTTSTDMLGATFAKPPLTNGFGPRILGWKKQGNPPPPTGRLILPSIAHHGVPPFYHAIHP
jgi:hypothetical protein